MVEAFAVGVESLKQVNQKHSVTEIDDVMDELGNVLADQAELEKAIGANVADPNLEFDESELDRELEALVAEDMAEKRAKREEEVREEKGRKSEDGEEYSDQIVRRGRIGEEEKASLGMMMLKNVEEAELDKDIEKWEKQQGEQKGDSSVDALADMVGEVKLENRKANIKQTEAVMLA